MTLILYILIIALDPVLKLLAGDAIAQGCWYVKAVAGLMEMQ